MACTSFEECVSDPLSGNERFTSISNLSRFSVNVTIYIFYGLLIVWTGYSLMKAIYSLYGAADEAESYEKFRNGITNAVLAAVGIIAIFSARFVLKVILELLGIPADQNIFGDGSPI